MMIGSARFFLWACGEILYSEAAACAALSIASVELLRGPPARFVPWIKCCALECEVDPTPQASVSLPIYGEQDQGQDRTAHKINESGTFCTRIHGKLLSTPSTYDLCNGWRTEGDVSV